jgi:hypothetical protein
MSALVGCIDRSLQSTRCADKVGDLVLTPYDDYLVHQVPTTFDHAASGDPRWFDRYWFVTYEPEGRVALASGMGLYKNMNTLDGFGCAVVGDEQHNCRVSRALRPDLTTACGPLRVDVLEGLRRFQLTMMPNESGVAFDLEWVAGFPPAEEEHHFSRAGGMVQQDYARFDQHGKVHGTVWVDGTEFHTPPEGWWAFRDHSFGVRPGMGGALPPTAPPHDGDGGAGVLGGLASGADLGMFFGCAFGTDDLAGQCQFSEAPDGTVRHIDGRVTFPFGSDKRRARFIGVEHDLAFFPGTRALRQGHLAWHCDNGETIEVEIESLTRPMVYTGFGYGDGYWDEQGLGAYRGKVVLEHDRYHLPDPETVVDLGGRREFVGRAGRDSAWRITSGGKTGYCEGVYHVMPSHQRYGA